MKTSANRILFPEIGYRKSDLMDFYGAIAHYLLPHLKDRPVTLKRYPDTVTGEVFYEKDAPTFTASWVKTCRVPRQTGEADIHYILVNDRRTLEWCASVATIEFHPFLHIAANIAQPTAIVFDLDPGAPADILTCASVAFRVRDLLADYGLRSFPKVSGCKGIQMYAPLNTPVTYEQTGRSPSILPRRSRSVTRISSSPAWRKQNTWAKSLLTGTRTPLTKRLLAFILCALRATSR